MKNVTIDLRTPKPPKNKMVRDLKPGVLFKDHSGDVGLRTDTGCVYFSVFGVPHTPFHIHFEAGDNTPNYRVEAEYGPLVIKV